MAKRGRESKFLKDRKKLTYIPLYTLLLKVVVVIRL